MRALAQRVRRMERRHRDMPCSCGGPWRMSIVLEHDEPMPGPCPKCGTTGKVIVLYPDTPPPGWVADEGVDPCNP